jgi:homocysteine S-methyltransferase
MGTMLYARGASSEQCLEQLVLTRPAWVTEIHQAYASAGAEVLTAHSFGASRTRLAHFGLAEQVREINFKAVRLARDVREVAGRAIFIAGNVGPLGGRLVPDGTLTQEEADAAFREQVAVLWEAGADLILFETFSALAELEVAVRAARAVCDLPIVASMTFGRDAREGAAPDSAPLAALRRLRAAGADVVGVNCSVGPTPLLATVTALHAAEPGAWLSAMPNAGFPERVEGRFYYPSSPEYFARYTPLFVEQGARLVGGCCGTTPMHTRAMRAALDAHLAQAAPALVVGDVPEAPPMPAEVSVALAAAEYAGEGGEQATSLLQKLRAGKFVISVEVDPPRAFSAEKQVEGALHARRMGADAVNVADSPMARVRMGALALCVQIQQRAGIDTIVHFTTRDRSLMGLQADLIGAHALGVRNVLALTGDPPSLGDTQQSSAVYDVDSVGLVRIIRRFNEGYDQNGRDMGTRSAFTIAVACDPTRADVEEEVERFQRKVSGGAHFAMTQPIYAPEVWARFVELYERRFGAFPVPVLIGVLPLQGHKHATFLHNEVPGITLTEEALERMRRAGAQGRQEGVAMAQELLLQLKELPAVQGVYLMPSFGRYELACQVLEVLPREDDYAFTSASTQPR